VTRRAGRQYQTFKAAIRAAHAAHGLPCQMERCLYPARTIDYRRQYPDPQAWSLDHIRALHQGGAEFDPANSRASHLLCNQSAGGRAGNRKLRAMQAMQEPAPTQTPTSTRW